MTETTPAPDADRDTTLDLLVPAPSRTRRVVALAAGLGLVVTVVVGGIGWPRVSASAWGFTRDADTDPVALAGTELRITGLGAPVTLRAVQAPPGWRVRSAGVVDPRPGELTDVVDTRGLRQLPARVRDGSRIVVEWEIECEPTLASLRSTGASSVVLATDGGDWFDDGDGADDGAEPVLVGNQAASLDLRVLGASALPAPVLHDGRTAVVRTPTFDVAAACGLSPADEATLRTSRDR